MKISRVFVVLTLLQLAGCAPHFGENIEVPIIPPASSTYARAKLNVVVQLGELKDVRDQLVGEDLSGMGGFTQPRGDVSGKVTEALTGELQARGVQVSPGAPLTIWGEVRRWRSHVATTSVSAIDSEASLYLEVVN